VKDTKSGAWGGPLFLSASQASFGPQAGGRESFMVLLLMSTNSTLSLTQPNFQFGGGVSVTAGNTGGGVDGTIASPDERVLVYGDSAGFYGGASVETGRFTPDADDNFAYYGQYLTPSRILFEHEGKPTEAARELAQDLARFAK
jgi:lipid-binding SYLF domain-containing protein